jgi:hypothetical protein
MVKGLIRFAVIWAISMYLTPYLNRALLQLAAKAPKNSFVEEMLTELSDQYSSSIIRSLGETVGELFLGSKKR